MALSHEGRVGTRPRAAAAVTLGIKPGTRKRVVLGII